MMKMNEEMRRKMIYTQYQVRDEKGRRGRRNIVTI
jgi:hypothetical protein